MRQGKGRKMRAFRSGKRPEPVGREQDRQEDGEDAGIRRGPSARPRRSENRLPTPDETRSEKMMIEIEMAGLPRNSWKILMKMISTRMKARPMKKK